MNTNKNLPNDCIYSAKVEDGKFKSHARALQIDFSIAIIKEMERYMKIGIPCSCPICNPATDLNKASLELMGLKVHIINLIEDVISSNDIGRITELSNSIKKTVLQNTDDCTIRKTIISSHI